MLRSSQASIRTVSPSSFGYQVRPRDPRSSYPDAADFAQGLAWLLDNDRWRDRGQRGYEHVAMTFETEAAIQRHIAVYRQHLGSEPLAPRASLA